MKHKWITCYIAVFLLLSCGCSLAQPLPESQLPNSDRLVGVLVTTEYLDLFDMEAWLNDNLNQLNMGGTTQVSGDTSAYERRIYAERSDIRSTASDGSTRTSYTWVFPETINEITGGLFICPFVTDAGTGEQYTQSVTSGSVSDAHTHIKSTDAGDSIELRCTVYFDPYAIQKEAIKDGETGAEMEQIVFYTNPVYQTPDGDVYVTSGMGNSYTVEKDLSMDLFHSSSTLTDSQSTTINGEHTVSENKVTVNYQGVRMAREITVLEMRADHKLLRKQSYTPADFPTEIKVNADTAYVTVETVSTDSDGNETISRQVCSANHPDESFEIFVPAQNGYAVKQTTKVVSITSDATGGM